MTAQHDCPRCQIPIDEARRIVQPVICSSCGFVVSKNSSADIELKLERNNMRLIVAISLAVLVAFSHLASWGSHSLEIRWLQALDLTGMASTKSMERMGSICLELKKFRCLEYSLKRQAQIDRSHTGKLAEYQMSRGKFKEAALALKSYLKLGHKDAPAMLLYARALGQTGQIDEAAQYYEKLISAQARVLQPQVIKNYVTDLARAKRYTQAQAVILRMRRNHARAGQFMEQEFRLLDATNYGRQTASH